jgi:hypothetical protein
MLGVVLQLRPILGQSGGHKPDTERDKEQVQLWMHGL